MAAKVLRSVTAGAATVGLLLAPASAGAQSRAHVRHASGRAGVSDVCHSVTLPGVPPPFNVVTICVPVPSVG
jgi:hypothetical protein